MRRYAMTHGQWKLPVDVLEEISRPATLADPYPFPAWVRDHDPVQVTPTGIYLVTRYADGREVLQNLELFRNPERDEIFRLFPTAHRHRSQLLLLNTVALHNPLAHTRLRRLVARDFTAQRVDDLLAEERRRYPRNDLISAMVALHEDNPDILSADEFMSMLWGLWAGGFATTTCRFTDHR